MSPTTWRRWSAALTACAVTALGGALAAGPAHADAGPTLQLSGNSQVGLAVPSDNDGQVGWALDTQGHTVHDLHVTVDITGISSFVSTTDDYCVNGLCTWNHDEVDEHGTGGLVDIAPKPDAKLGATGTAVVSATASDATIQSFTVQVTVGKVGLTVGNLKEIDDAKPGSTLTAPLTVSNIGSLVSATTDYTFVVSPGLGFAQHFPNCDYGTTKDPIGPGITVEDAVCHFTTPVEPGKKYQLSTPLKLKVKKSALFEFFGYTLQSTSSTVPATVKSADAGALSLVPDGNASPTPDQAGSHWVVNAANTADLAVTGDTATGRPGSEVTLTATVRDLGPASVYLATSDDQLSLLVDIPKGTTTTKVPSSCGPWTGDGRGEPALGAPQYICELHRPFNAGDSEKLAFTVKVGSNAPATTSGKVRPQLAYGGEPPYDQPTANSTGTFTVHVPGGAVTTGGSGSTGGSSDGNQPATLTGATSGSSGSAGGTSGNLEPNGSLASTGSQGTLTVAWTGAAALALGGALFAFVRSRKLRARA